MPTFFLLLPLSPGGDCSMRRERRREREGEKGLFPPLVLPTQPQPTYLTSTSSPHFPTRRPPHPPTDRPTARTPTNPPHAPANEPPPLHARGAPFFQEEAGRQGPIGLEAKQAWRIWARSRWLQKRGKEASKMCCAHLFICMVFSPSDPSSFPSLIPPCFQSPSILIPLSMYAIVRRTWYSRSYT